jgi:hypothetical protein
MKTKSESTQEKASEKLVEGHILIMDIAAVPRDHGLDTEKWAYLIKEQGVLFYDSKSGDAPTFQPEDATIKMYDVKEEENMKLLESELANLEGPLEPILQGEVDDEPTDSSLNNSMSASSFTTDGSVLTVGGESGLSVSAITGDVIYDGGPMATPTVTTLSPEETLTFIDNWEAAAIAPIVVNDTQVPIITGTGGQMTVGDYQQMETSFEIEEALAEHPYGVLTEERIVNALDEIEAGRGVIIEESLSPAEVMARYPLTPEQAEQVEGLANRNQVAVVGGPLTDNEIGQLGIEDPRGQDTLGAGVSQEENARIDAVMSATSRVTTRTTANGTRITRRRALRSPGFELTDDTE